MHFNFGPRSETGFTHPLSLMLSYSEAVRNSAPDWVLTTVALAFAGKLIHANQPEGVLRILTQNGHARVRLDAKGECLRDIFPVETDLADGELAYLLQWDGYRTVMDTL
ncbi:MAG: hypothetical protein K9K68_05730 [Methylococcaceae bacterium]|jgi:hypothetical protein|nr:hypothetical protein [Methylococcaceae bacterium]